MRVILLERIEKLGSIGDVVTVNDGYARHFLLPNKKALRANHANRKLFEANRARIEADNAYRRGEALKAGEKIDGISVVLIRAASDSGQLYGTLSVRDIVEALNANGAEVAKGMIVLERQIKTIGLFDVRVALHPEVSVMVKVNVARSSEEAQLQAQGVDVIAAASETLTTGHIEAFPPADFANRGANDEAGDDGAYLEALRTDFISWLIEVPGEELDLLGDLLEKVRDRITRPSGIAGRGLGRLVNLAEGRAAIDRMAIDESTDDWAQSELLGAAEMAGELGISPATLANWRKAGQVIAFKRGPRNFRYPKRQVYRGAPIAGLAAVVRHFGQVEDAWEWLVTPNLQTLGIPPIDRLRIGALAEVERAAEGALDFS